MSEAEELVAFFEAHLPQMEANWRRIMARGYKARVDGKSRMATHRRHRALFQRGWDAADKELKEKENQVSGDHR